MFSFLNKSKAGGHRPPAGKSLARFSQSRFQVALARWSRCLEPLRDFSLFQPMDRLSAKCGFEPRLNQRDAGRFRQTAGFAAIWLKFLIGVTNRTCTGTNAVTGRDAAVTSSSP
jgi:hypothetical protein